MIKQSIKFAAIGECMLELRHVNDQLLALSFSGDTFNVALYLARYCQILHLTVNYITALGDDPYSRMMLNVWQQEGIKTNLTEIIPGSLPGIYLIRTDKKGERSFYYYRSESAAKKISSGKNWSKITKKLLRFDHLYFSGITLAILETKNQNRLLKFLKKARQYGAKISFDTNYRSILWKNKKIARSTLKKALQLTDIALVTFADEKKLFGDKNPKMSVKRLHQWGVKEVILKLGADGNLISTTEGQYLIPAKKISKIVDTTAAGDSFNAAYLGSRIKGLDPIQATKNAQRLAATVIQYPGAIIPKKAMPELLFTQRRKEE